MTLWSSEVGPYLWHDFDSDRLRSDLHAIGGTELRTLRVLLPWDAFAPTVAGVPPVRLRQLELLLHLAEEQGIGVVPVLFSQTIGDCVMLPPYAIDVGGTRPGVRVVTDAVVQPGGPRDQHTDPLMLEVQLRMIEQLTSAFGRHPALRCWDLGHDPASAMRPRRTAEQRHWCTTLAAALHDRGERCMLSLGWRDLTTARGVRPHVLATQLDSIGLVLEFDQLVSGRAATARDGVFMARLLLRLSGAATPVAVHVTVPAAEIDGTEEFARSTSAGLVEVGCSAVHALWWSCTGPRTERVPPFDRRPDLGRRGLVDTVGEQTHFGRAWIEAASGERERSAAQPWPPAIDVDDYYANLPESLNDLRAAWEAEDDDTPAILR